MSISQKDKVKAGLSIIFLIIAAVVYLAAQLGHTKNAPIFRYSEEPDSYAKKLLTHWRTLPVIHGEMEKNIWERQVLVAFIFSMSNCGICLPRVHECVTYADSLIKKNNINIGLFCVGISQNPILLDRYVTASPKPFPVLGETGSSIEPFDYGYTSKIIVIDRRYGLAVAETIIGKGQVPRRLRNEFKTMITNGY